MQVRTDLSSAPFILFGDGVVEEDAVLLQDAGRTAVLAHGTVMAKVAASQKWVPLTDVAAVDGSAIPLGIYVGQEVAAADLVAGDVIDSPILVGGSVLVDKQQVTLENSVAFTDIIGTGVYQQTVKDYLVNAGIYVEATMQFTHAENA